MRNKKAVVLLSGGLDSATTLFLAKKQGFRCYCLVFDYGQRHKKELNCAVALARRASCPYRVLKIILPWQGSSLLDKKIALKDYARFSVGRKRSVIPDTYVPARNIIFLSFALSYAEAINASAIFIGVHAQDYSGYPDCRPEFYRAFNQVIKSGTKARDKIKILTAIIHKNKKDIIRLAAKLGVPFELTWSCYRGLKKPCSNCDSCFYRAKGFREAGLKDPLIENER